MKANKKIFLLGVGCQKGGTTWLHRLLSKHPSVDLGFAKEYHIFDALHLDACEEFMRDRLKKLKYLMDENRVYDREADKYLLKSIDFCRDIENYFDYFDYLYLKSDRTRLVGDITPSYAGLAPSVLREIKRSLNARGFSVRVVFLMRDPVERVWSQVRMDRRERRAKNSDCVFDMSETDELLSSYDTVKYEFRTRYELTIKNLESVFSKDSIFYGLYESFFTEQSICRLARFLGTPNLNPDFSFKVNISSKENQCLDEYAFSKVASFYKETYLYCDEQFNTQQLWPGYKYL
ncbi:MAG: sulfotransferase [Pseudomonadales bacterium]|nr:sulfotransferase [Pseudomonadales bacterium]